MKEFQEYNATLPPLESSYVSDLSKGTSPIYAGGSFVIAAVCKDGILISAESRNTINNNAGKPIAYYDGVQKVFPIGNSAIAYTGSGFIQNLDFGVLVDAFKETLKSDIPLDQLLPAFLNFCDSNLPIEARIQVRNQKLISAGYLAGQPVACYYSEAQTEGPKQACAQDLVSSDRTIVDDYLPELRSMEHQRLAALIRKAIPQYAEEKATIGIGGSIYILSIFRDSSRWLDAAPNKRGWNNLHEFANVYQKGGIKVHLLPDSTKSELEELIRRGEKWSRGD